MRFLTIYTIIGTIMAILYTGAACFYRAVNNDIPNAITNGILCLVNIGILSLIIDNILD